MKLCLNCSIILLTPFHHRNRYTSNIMVATKEELVFIDSKYFFKKQIFFNSICWFIFGCPESSLLCGLFSSCEESGLLPSCGAWAPGCGCFSSCATWDQQLWRPGSIAVVHGVSCSATCGISPDQGWNSCSILHWQVDSLPLSHQGSLIASTFI